jgi:hypothetical protein
MLQRLRNTADSLLKGIKGISPNVDRFLDEHRNEPIRQLIIPRNEISPLITGTSNIFSQISKRITVILYIFRNID